MNFKDAVISTYTQPFNFSTRASRSEVWWSTLFIFLFVGVSIVLIQPMGGVFGVLLAIVFMLFTFYGVVCSWAVSCRRMHDTGHTGWWLLLSLIPFVALPVSIWLLFKKGDPDDNIYGYVPY